MKVHIFTISFALFTCTFSAKISFNSSDNEYETTPNICSNDQFVCKNGNCLLEDSVCDSYNDCGDESDEENCGLWSFWYKFKKTFGQDFYKQMLNQTEDIANFFKNDVEDAIEEFPKRFEEFTSSVRKVGRTLGHKFDSELPNKIIEEVKEEVLR